MKLRYLFVQVFVKACFLLALPLIAQAQNTGLAPNIENVIPPSPNVSALNKFGNIPIGPSTGIPQVSIPIYSWSGRNTGLSANLSLDYHLGGIKVDETASNIGLGWALNAGGVVSRTVRGIYDEAETDGFFDQTLPVDEYAGNTYGVSNSDRALYRMYMGVEDTQNDLFNFNFNGRSGRFVLGKNNDLLILTQEKIKIEKFTGTVNGKTLLNKFIITDEFGYKYVFEDYDFTNDNTNRGYTSTYTSAWYLTRILTPSGNDSIEFEYETTTYTVTTYGGMTVSQPLVGTGDLTHTTTGGSGQTITAKRIKKITYPDGNIVDFYYDSTQRTDLTGDYLLKKIKISKGSSVRGFTLAHDYSLSRATLLSVTPFGSTSETADKPYTFEYVTYPVLPVRGGAKDHWGYFTGGNYLGSIPKHYIMAPGGQYPPFREFGSGSRDTDPVAILSGSMTRINYPTGGYTLFEMEANQAKDNWLEQNDTVTINLPPYTWKSLNEGLNSDNNPAASFPLLFDGANSTTTDFEIIMNPSGGTCGGSCGIKFELYDASNSLITTQQANFPSSPGSSQTLNFSVYGLVNGATYTMKCYTLNLTGYYEYIEVRWKEIASQSTSEVVLSHVQPYVGGLRAKKISDYTQSGGSAAMVKEYEYTLADGVTSSGTLGTKPQYTYLVYYDYKLDASLFENPSYHGNFDYNYAISTANPIHDIAYINGSPVTYSRVVEKSTSGGVSNGKTVRHFTSFKDFPPNIQDIFPTVPVAYTTWSYGLLTKEEIYDASNTLLKKTENSYSNKVDNYYSNSTRLENFRSISVAPVKFLWSGSITTPHVDPAGDPHYFLMTSFTPYAGRNELDQTVVTEYFPNSIQLTNTTSYMYDQDMYYLKETEMVNSKGEDIRMVNIYPKDKVDNSADPNGVYAAMISRNMIRNQVEESRYNGSTHLDSRLGEYANWSTDTYKLANIYSKKAADAAEKRVKYLNYDTHGAPLSVSLENGQAECYVWGYGGDRLIAKITNAGYSSVSSLLGGTSAIETFRNIKNPTDSQVETFLAPLHSSLSGAQIDSFCYDTMAGISKHTDAKNMTLYYEYDIFQRLKQVKDQDGNVVKAYQYNYKQ